MDAGGSKEFNAIFGTQKKMKENHDNRRNEHTVRQEMPSGGRERWLS